MATGTINKPTTASVISATGSSNTETSTGSGDSIVQITLTTATFNTGSYSVSSGGVVVPTTGIYRVYASVYFHVTSASTSDLGVYVKTGTAFNTATEIAATSTPCNTNAAQPTVFISPCLVSLTAGNKVYLGCRTRGAAGGYYAGNKATFLQLEFIQ